MEVFSQPPVPVVALMGASDVHGAVEKCVSRVRMGTTEGPRVRLVSLHMGLMFPAKKNKKARVQSGLPAGGIIKAHWLEKHYSNAPAVLVLLFSYKPSTLVSHDTQRLEALTNIDLMKKNVAERQIQLLVAWVVDGSEGRAFEEFKVDFMGKAGFDSSASVLVLDTSDLNASVARLEDAACKSAAAHYRLRLRALKKERGRFNRTTQMQLQVRSFWKSGFYSELVGDSLKAVKHYQRALDVLTRDLPSTLGDGVRLMELKVVAEFVVLRICRLCLMRGDTVGSCERLQRMLLDFRGRVGPEPLAFQHWAWLAHVHEGFAKLLQAFGRPDQPLSAGPENPGFHFQAAAKYTELRRTAALARKQAQPTALTLTDSLPDTPSKLDSSRQKFLGQPYEEFQAHPLELKGVAERDRIPSAEMELAKELNYPHSESIVSQLHRAYKFYRGQTHRRRQLHIACLLANEHFAAGAYDLALRFYAEISLSRGLFSWGSLLYLVRVRAADCADRLGLRPEFVRHALALLACSPPANAFAAAGGAAVGAGSRERLMERALEVAAGLDAPLVVDVTDEALALFRIDVAWKMPAAVAADSNSIVASLMLRSLLPSALSVVAMQLELASQDQRWEVSHGEGVTLEPRIAKLVDVVVSAVPVPAGARVVVSKLSLVLGPKLSLVLSSLPKCPSLTIPGRPTRVSLHLIAAPALWLENDHTPITVEIRNTESAAIVAGRLELDFVDSVGRVVPVGLPPPAQEGARTSSGSVQQPAAPAATVGPASTSAPPASAPAPAAVAAPLALLARRDGEPAASITVEAPLAPNARVQHTLWVRCWAIGEHSLVLRFEYATAEFASSAKLSLSAKVHKAFVCRFQLHREMLQPIPVRAPAVWMDRQTLLSSVLENVSPVPIRLLGAELKFDASDEDCVRTSQPHVATVTLQPHTQYTTWDAFVVKKASPLPRKWGRLEVRWCRGDEAPDALGTVTRIDFPNFVVEEAPFDYGLECPPSAIVGKAFRVRVSLTNHTNAAQQMFLFTRERRSNNEAVQTYALDGPKTLSFKVLPRSSWHVEYVVVPLAAGELALPSFIIKCKSKEVSSTVEGSDIHRSIHVAV